MKFELDLEPAKLDDMGKVVKPARTVVMRELPAGEFEQMLQTLTDAEKGDQWALVNHGLRRSIVSDRGQALEYIKLVGPQLTDRFSTRQLMMLRTAFEQLHSINEEDLVRVRTMRAIAD